MGRGKQRSKTQRATDTIRALELRLGGLRFGEIAEIIGVSESQVCRDVNAYLKDVPKQKADELREQELMRLDKLQLALWPAAMAGDTRATAQVIQIMQHRNKLTGLSASRTDVGLDVAAQISREFRIMIDSVDDEKA